MTPTDPSDPRAWLQRAHSNLILAQKGKYKGVMLEDLCFNTQQAAEKAIKAVCIYVGMDFPKVHSISHLMDILEARGLSIPESVKAADILTQYAVQTRYPGPIEKITLEEYEESLELAAKVVFWAEFTIEGNKQ